MFIAIAQIRTACKSFCIGSVRSLFGLVQTRKFKYLSLPSLKFYLPINLILSFFEVRKAFQFLNFRKVDGHRENIVVKYIQNEMKYDKKIDVKKSKIFQTFHFKKANVNSLIMTLLLRSTLSMYINVALRQLHFHWSPLHNIFFLFEPCQSDLGLVDIR